MNDEASILSTLSGSNLFFQELYLALYLELRLSNWFQH